MSAVTAAKRALDTKAIKRLAGVTGLKEPALQKHVDDWPSDWIAVVHADGNRLGQIFLGFADRIDPVVGAGERSRWILNQYRAFSQALDEGTRAAFQKTVQDVGVVPMLPLIVGGDDLTLLCDGRAALRLTRTFLERFEEQFQESDGPGVVLARQAQQALGHPRLGMCAGVAIVKPHYPFSSAYALCEQLLRSAKTVKDRVKEPCSALDFHIVYDPT